MKSEEKEHRTPSQQQTQLKLPPHKGRKDPPHLCQLIKALGMSLLPLHVALLGVAAIAIHDEGNVLGHGTCLENREKPRRAAGFLFQSPRALSQTQLPSENTRKGRNTSPCKEECFFPLTS